MKTSSLALAMTMIFSANCVLAEGEAKSDEPKASYTLSANAYLVSNYLFRGQTQTWGRPALQGGFDFVHESGVYVGTWASNVSGNQFAGGSLEMDLYAGYNGKISDDLGYSAGLLYYYYPGANVDRGSSCGTCFNKKFDTLEANVGASWSWLSTKLSYSLTDYFSADQNTLGLNGDSKGTLYLEGNANVPLAEGLTLVAHVGYLKYGEERATPLNGETDPSYIDWKLGVSYAMKDGWTAGAYYVDATNDDFYRGVTSFANSDTKDLNKSAVYLTIGRTF